MERVGGKGTSVAQIPTQTSPVPTSAHPDPITERLTRLDACAPVAPAAGESQEPLLVVDRAALAHSRSICSSTNTEALQQCLEASTETPAHELPLRRPHVILAASGSVASIKVIELAQSISKFASVVVLTTQSAAHFIELQELREKQGIEVFTDADEWANWKKLKDPVLHIELRKWADLIVVAPLSANTLAKLANGLSDNLVTCVARAWDFKFPFLVAPAMNTMMWDHPFTAKHLKELVSLGINIIPPVSKLLACGDIGNGALATVDDIVAAVKQSLAQLAINQQ